MSCADLLHSRQEGWECLLLAFRAGIRSRVPCFQIFLDQLKGLAQYVNLDECHNYGIPMMLFMSWRFHFWKTHILIKVRQHQWSNRTLTKDFFSNNVSLYFSCLTSFERRMAGWCISCLVSSPSAFQPIFPALDLRRHRPLAYFRFTSRELSITR